jgi:hypothetical protein
MHFARNAGKVSVFQFSWKVSFGLLQWRPPNSEASTPLGNRRRSTTEVAGITASSGKRKLAVVCEHNAERRTSTRIAANLQLIPHEVAKGPADGKAEATPAGMHVGVAFEPPERLEDFLDTFGGYAHSCIRYVNAGGLLAPRLQKQLNRDRAVLRELQRVIDDIPHHLFDLLYVGLNRSDGGR